MSEEKGKKFNSWALLSTAVAGFIVWSKRDLAKGIVKLRRSEEGFVRIKKEPEVFLTYAAEKNKDALFAYLTSASEWHLADSVADGYFWLNAQEEVLLLTQNSVCMGKYWIWEASKPFGI